jgi:hypothetical protein
MRQFVSLRFWLAIATLIGVTYGLWFLLVRPDDSVAVIGRPTRAATTEHRVNLLQPVYSIQADTGFAIVDGVATGDMHLVLDATRTMVVKAGTAGEITCSRLAEINQCVVAADLLGDAVVWFSLIPNPQRANLVLPGITAVRKENWVLLANGWEVSRSDVIDRNCDAASLDDFVHRFGGSQSTATFSFEQQQVIKVTCLEEPESPTTTSTTTTSPTGTTLVPAVSVPVDTAVPEEGVPAGTAPLDSVPPVTGVG